MAVISGFNPSPTIISNAPATQVVASATTTVSTKDAVASYFSDLPIMTDIAYCESRDRQTEKGGTIFRGEQNPNDVGVMQINETYHLAEAQKLGYDIYTLDGNMAFARYLYEKQGVKPWLSSSACWDQSSDIAMN